MKGEKKEQMEIRQEQPKDYKAVYHLVQQAFSQAEHRDGNEQDLVEALRKSDAFIPALSMVAEEGKRIVGYILFTKATIERQTVLALAPLAVLPGYQRRGIGLAMMAQGHETAARLGFVASVVLGARTIIPKRDTSLPAVGGFTRLLRCRMKILWRFYCGKMHQ